MKTESEALILLDGSIDESRNAEPKDIQMIATLRFPFRPKAATRSKRLKSSGFNTAAFSSSGSKSSLNLPITIYGKTLYYHQFSPILGNAKKTV